MKIVYHCTISNMGRLVTILIWVKYVEKASWGREELCNLKLINEISIKQNIVKERSSKSCCSYGLNLSRDQ